MKNCLILFFLLLQVQLFAQDINLGQLLHYSFDNNYMDSSPNGFDGTPMGTSFTTDRFGNANSAVFFDGFSNFIEMPNEATLRPQFPFTIAMWFNANSVDGGNNSFGLIDNCFVEDDYHGAWIAILNNGSRRIGIAYGNGVGCIGPTCANSEITNRGLKRSRWYHLTAVYESPTDLRLYLNGCLQETFEGGTGNFELEYEDIPGSLGRVDNSTDIADPFAFFHGAMDDVYMWDRAITQAEIDILYDDFYPNESTVTYNGCAGDGFSTTINGTEYNEANTSGTEVLENCVGCDSTITIDLNYVFCGGAQPEPCGNNPAMTSFCETACVICDIDGFTGRNDLTAAGQAFEGCNPSNDDDPDCFCTTQYNNMQYIAFIAGSTSLTIRVDVDNCDGLNSLELGFFKTDDCINFERITFCNTQVESGDSETFITGDVDNDGVAEFPDPLIIGQHYYLIMDGSGGSNCDWTFTVEEGSTEVLPLTTSGVISLPEDPCIGVPYTVTTTTGEVGAAQFFWRIDGFLQPSLAQTQEFTFDQAGTYEICVIAANVCDEAPESCTTITVREVGSTLIEEALCDGDCIEANGKLFCTQGIFQEIIPLANGCDSIVDIEIEIIPQASEDLNVWICNVDSFFIGPNAYFETGLYRDTILTALLCDSIVSLDLRAIECEIIGSAAEVPVICNGTATGTLIFSVDQGEAPLTFTYTNIADPSITGTGTTNLLTNNQITGIPAGIYQIYIQDDFNNDVVVLQEVTEPPVLEIGLSALDLNGFNVSCNMDNGMPGADGEITAQMLGGVPPYDYLWSDGQTTQTATGLTAGPYSVIVTDDVGCTIESSFTLIPPPPVVPEIDFRDPTCEGFESGEIEVIAVIGGTQPYAFSLTDGNFGTGQLFPDLVEGTYRIYIQDANGCVSFVESDITAPQIPVVDFANNLELCLGDSIQLNPIVNDINVKEIVWTNPNTLSCDDCLEPFARPFNDAEYTLTVISQDDCEDTADLRIRVEKKRRVYVPNIFSPNNDGINDIFTVYSAQEVVNIEKLTIFDRWGNLVFEQKDIPSNDESVGWNGQFNDQRLNPGVFAWYAEIEFLDGEKISYSGSITLSR